MACLMVVAAEMKSAVHEAMLEMVGDDRAHFHIAMA